MTDIALLAVTLMLAYSNGSNDNFKGVATLFGSRVLDYRQARWLSTAATFIGALAAALLADTLLKAFSGRGLVPASVVADPAFAGSVAIAAAVTVALATRIGMPISTTHALVGALVGTGLVAAGDSLQLSALAQQFLAPLLLGPLLAFMIAAALANLQRRFWPNPTVMNADEPCVCVDATAVLPSATALVAQQTPAFPAAIASAAPAASALPLFASGTTQGRCAPYRRSDSALVVTQSRALNIAHIISAACVCFARGLNDAPKIAALLLVAKSLDTSLSVVGVAAAMTLGGWLHSRRIAETMSHKIVTLEPRSAFLANLCTSVLVIAASKFGLPLSTTHVSVGAISGLSARGEKISRATLGQILLSWVATLPCAALIGSAAYAIIG